ncbi:hypothetical protein NDU88_002171 [Pleurodeles waltl]|uniref:Uncharacterized protein n=1 Tax=Pleurodeles waltl TaxID=8319 RepID=A0AAV7NCY9_PLEWA|nr:hypothetical protein NDU88_002171 [Pleurodeles waltl]
MGTPPASSDDFNLNMANHGKRSTRERALDQSLGVPQQVSRCRDMDKCDHPLVRALEAFELRALNCRFLTDCPMNPTHKSKKSASTLDYTFVSMDLGVALPLEAAPQAAPHLDMELQLSPLEVLVQVLAVQLHLDSTSAILVSPPQLV